MMSLGFWNSLKMYFFSFFLNFLYWSLASLCSDVVPKTAPKYSTSPLKFLVDNVYAEWLKRPPRPPRPWWSPLPVRPPWPRPHPLFLELDLLVSESRVIVASLTSPSLLPASGEAVYFSGVIVVYSFFLNTVKLTLLYDEPNKVLRTWSRYSNQ